MGGDIILRALTISPDIKAAVLYASLIGDEARNSQLLWYLSGDPAFQKEAATPPEVLKQISPKNYYQYINAPIQLFHGAADPTIPVEWAQASCTALTNAGVNINCIYFTGEGHTFRSRVSDQFFSAQFAFYKKYLAP
jgi:dipeptidyl aminopeptidase/acylaminoacyl peptidase